MQSNWSQDKYIKASRYAAEAHQGQTVPGTELPYLLHLNLASMEVIAALLTGNQYDADLAVQCALLHDVLEDTATTYKQIEQEFGVRIADGVLALSKDENLDKSLRLSDSLKRIRQQPHEVWMVKMADRITNLQPPPPNWTKARAAQYREEALEIHGALKDANEMLAAWLLAKIESYKAFIE
jgi:(p)ppGpp synthase/HD superfamily hydrolase